MAERKHPLAVLKKLGWSSKEKVERQHGLTNTNTNYGVNRVTHNQAPGNEASKELEYRLSEVGGQPQESSRERKLEEQSNFSNAYVPCYEDERARSSRLERQRDSITQEVVPKLGFKQSISLDRWSVDQDKDIRYDRRRHGDESIMPRIDTADSHRGNTRHSAALESIKTLPKPTKRLRYDQYTVGWICALSKEMTAAKAMLDEVHLSLPNPRGDYNAYQLGSIGNHNVVITCIRSGVYGTTSATAAAITMCSTYPNCNITPLLVGIGGGVPAPETHDIRLGDVVISTPSPERPAVVQYDYGKMGQDGDFHIKGSLNKPSPALLSALAHFRSELVSNTDKASKHMSKALEEYRSLGEDGFSYPGAQKDVLMGYQCEHSTQWSDCSGCSVQPMIRKPRHQTRPKIHYGSIASGNSVIKYGPTRDRIADKLGVLCFEMEAAGVMDYFPCLVIRGICDYCDAHKSKEWQEYAALAAAAVAKEVLSCVAFLKESIISDADLQKKVKDRQALLNSLDFEESNTRRATVRRAHSQTCKWILQQPQLQHWLMPRKGEHYGLLWIKGKPGAGKSTIMKYLLEHVEDTYQNSKSESVLVVSFFFNARGPELGRSTTGMYRSLLGQILQQRPVLQSLLEKQQNRMISDRIPPWTVETLEDLLGDVVKCLDGTYLICCIDALDECPEDQVRQMVEFFDHLAQLDLANHLQVCFSSRHYPHISTKQGSEFILDTQEGHSQDILNYLDSELILNRDDVTRELKSKMYKKSEGIFLWIVLVVRILKSAFDRGEVHKLIRILDEIPSQVNELFRDMLTRDGLNLPEFVASIRWVLYARRSLTVAELYYAILLADPSCKLEFHRKNAALGVKDMWRYILSCSKGMLETTASSRPTVQFIHETVREFLLQPSTLAQLQPSFEGISEGESQNLLAQCCHRYIQQVGAECFNLGSRPDVTVPNRHPFFGYVLHCLLDHSNQAERCGVSQSQFLEGFDHMVWFRCCVISAMDGDQFILRNVFPVSLDEPLVEPYDFVSAELLGLVLVRMDLDQLFRCWLQEARNLANWSHVAPCLMLECVFNGNRKAFIKVVRAGHATRSVLGCEISHINVVFDFLYQISLQSPHTKLHVANLMANVLHVNIGKTDPDRLNEALHLAAESLAVDAIRLFLDYGADPSATDASGDSVIHRIIAVGQPRRKRRNAISSFGADKNFDHGSNVDDLEIKEPPSTICIRHLLNAGGDVNAQNKKGDSLLHYAIGYRCQGALKLLLHRHATIDTIDQHGKTPLHLAIGEGHLVAIETLVNRGASVDIRDHYGLSALHMALMVEDDEYGNNLIARYSTMEQDALTTFPIEISVHFRIPKGLVARILCQSSAQKHHGKIAAGKHNSF